MPIHPAALFPPVLLLTLALAACQPPSQVDPHRESATGAAMAAAQETEPTANQAGGPATGQPVVRYQCGEIAVSARFSADDSSVDLVYSGQRHTLARDGAQYADATGNVFRNGEPALLALDGDAPRECTPTDHISPWERAAARGIVFRAVGQEPGWLVEVGGGEPRMLSAQLDYGERSIELAHAIALADGEGFGGKTDDGTSLRLEITRAACADPMSGERFEATARLQVGEREYHGCGAYLAP